MFCRVSEEELEKALAASVTCSILAAAGPQRSRMLATLYKDERTAKLDVFPFLEKVYMERILGRYKKRHAYIACEYLFAADVEIYII